MKVHPAVFVGLGYLGAGLIAAGVLATTGPDRLKNGQPAFTGFTGKEPAWLQLGETVAFWPWAMGYTFLWGK